MRKTLLTLAFAGTLLVLLAGGTQQARAEETYNGWKNTMKWQRMDGGPGLLGTWRSSRGMVIRFAPPVGSSGYCKGYVLESIPSMTGVNVYMKRNPGRSLVNCHDRPGSNGGHNCQVAWGLPGNRTLSSWITFLPQGNIMWSGDYDDFQQYVQQSRQQPSSGASGSGSGMSRDQCVEKLCPGCARTISLLGVSTDPECDACLKRNRSAIQACIQGRSGSGGTGAAGGGRTGQPPVGGSAPGNGGSGTAAEEGTCYVGQRPGSNPPRLAVGCDGNDGPGPTKLMLHGYGTIVLGPASWKSCTEYMRRMNQPGW